MGLRYALASAALLLLARCAAPPPPPPPTVVNLTLLAGPDANPTASGSAAPVMVRVYQLTSPSGFGNAEFFQLFGQDQATLQTDLVHRDDFVLAPGQTRTATLMPMDQVRYLGVFAVLRDFQDAAWRGGVPIAAHKTNEIRVVVSRSGVTASAQPAPPGPAGS